MVSIKRSLYDWIEASRYAERLALNAVKEQVRVDKKLVTSDVERLISDIQHVFVSAPYAGPDARIFFQQFIEKCIWCTTYNLDPQITSISGGLVTDFVIPPEYGDKFWARLTERYLVPGTGAPSTYAQSTRYPDVYPNAKWIKFLEQFPHLGSSTALQLSYDLMALKKTLLDNNLDMAQTLVRQLSP